MKIGVSSACFYPMYIENSMDILSKAGFSDFEIFFNSFSELDESFLKEIKQKGNALSVHQFTSAFEGVMFFSDHYRRFLDSVHEYEKYFSAAKFLGAEFVVLHGQKDYIYSSLSDEEYIERYSVLYEKAQEYGITLAQENVVKCRSEKTAFIEKMRKKLDNNCAFVLDIKQCKRAGQDVFKMCEAMGDRLVHLHASDNNENNTCMLPGTGTFDFRALQKKLSEIGYKGKIIIELYSKNFSDVSELAKSKEFLEDIFN